MYENTKKSVFFQYVRNSVYPTVTNLLFMFDSVVRPLIICTATTYITFSANPRGPKYQNTRKYHRSIVYVPIDKIVLLKKLCHTDHKILSGDLLQKVLRIDEAP